MSGIGESRSELLAWLNDLLRLNFQRVEECGTGAAYCQIMDSIFLDVPMHRVKFDVTQEYDYYPNYKILQSCFARHKIEKIVYVEKLVKCRFQDNLEFLQWIKKYWMQHKDSNPYDPLQRRRATRQVSNGNVGPINSREQTPAAAAAGNSLNVTRRRPMLGQNSSNHSLNHSTTNNNTLLNNNRSTYGNRKSSNEQFLSLQNDLNNATEKIKNLTDDIEQYKETTTILEREREFYFGKLRDIEILVQSTQDLIKEGLYKNNGTDELTKFLNRVQQILYATDENYTEDDNFSNNNSNNINNNHANDNDGSIYNLNQDLIQNRKDNRQMISDPTSFINNNNNDTIGNNISIQNRHLATAGPQQPTNNHTTNLNTNLIIDEETF